MVSSDIFFFKNGVMGSSIFNYWSRIVFRNVTGGYKKGFKIQTKGTKGPKYGLK